MPTARFQLPAAWRAPLANETRQEYYQRLERFLQNERATQTIFPAAADTFAALELTSLEQTTVVLLGQDPYHGAGQAHGLCFSVPPGVPTPPSLRNIFKELVADQQITPPADGHLEPWARQGVLLLNTVLTVRAHEPNSHRQQGWEQFTDAVIGRVNEKQDPVVFVLWGKPARQKRDRIDTERHVIIESAHPSPLSAHRGFFGSRPFAQINAALVGFGKPAIDWQL